MASLPALPELRHRPVTSGTERGRSRHDGGQRDEALAQQERRALAAWSKRTATPGRTPGCQRVVDHDKAPPHSNLPPDDPAQRRDQAEQPELFEHPVCQPSRGVSTAWVTCPPDASRAPTISSNSVSRATSGLDCTISPTHRQRAAGNRDAAPWRLRAFGCTPAT